MNNLAVKVFMLTFSDLTHMGMQMQNMCIREHGKGMVSIYITATPCEAVLANAILQFCINVYIVCFNIPSSKVIRQDSIKVKQRKQCRSTSENLIKFMVPDFFLSLIWSMVSTLSKISQAFLLSLRLKRNI